MRILKEQAAGLIVDIQEKLYPHIHDHQQIVKNTAILIKGLKTLDVPLLVTEQYTKGLGKTVAPVDVALDTYAPVEKIAFSCCDEPLFSKSLDATNRKFVIMAGIETHVCVLQTAVDLLQQDYQPIVVADCVSSRKPHDKTLGLERMKQEGVLISSYESILFELCRYAGTTAFKTISKLVK